MRPSILRSNGDIKYIPISDGEDLKRSSGLLYTPLSFKLLFLLVLGVLLAFAAGLMGFLIGKATGLQQARQNWLCKSSFKFCVSNELRS